ncbi:MAG: DUF362 domain-containing protein [Candidatus Omnitrophica bacterium]|nr:DUF362 domain-containing protein [Candidatus Omnitrophota bacterium]
MNSKVSIVRCNSYTGPLVWDAVKKSIEALGGISNFIKPESRVLVKPNLLMAKEPEFGITTHPEVVRAVVKVLKEINCRIFIGDGPSVWGAHSENADEVYECTGLKKISEEEGVELVKFDKKRWRGKFPLTTWLDNCDHLVSVPKFKTHELTTLTAAIKNLYGLVSDTFKTELHRKYFDVREFCNILVDILEEVRPALSVIDGVIAMEGDGPATSGKLYEAGVVLAGSDCAALDSILAFIMGLEPCDILTTKEAARRGLGVADIKSIQVLGEPLENVIERDFELPRASLTRRLPRPVTDVIRRLIRFYPKVEHGNCIRCGSCIKACPKKVISMKKERISIDYSGCISCFCCQEICPASAIKVKKGAFARLIGL